MRACSIFEKRGGKKAIIFSRSSFINSLKLSTVCLCACLYMLYVLTCTRLHAFSCCECADVRVFACRSRGTHLGLPGRFLALLLTLLKRFTPAGHLTTSAWLRNKNRFRHFILLGVNSVSSFWQQGKGWFVYSAE